MTWTVHLEGRLLGSVDAADELEARRRALFLARSQGHDRGVAFFINVRPTEGAITQAQRVSADEFIRSVEAIAATPAPQPTNRFVRAWRVLIGKE